MSKVDATKDKRKWNVAIMLPHDECLYEIEYDHSECCQHPLRDKGDRAWGLCNMDKCPCRENTPLTRPVEVTEQECVAIMIGAGISRKFAEKNASSSSRDGWVRDVLTALGLRPLKRQSNGCDNEN